MLENTSDVFGCKDIVGVVVWGYAVLIMYVWIEFICEMHKNVNNAIIGIRVFIM